MDEVVKKFKIDFSNSEVQDIYSAVSEMLDRVKRKANKRGVFSITFNEPCGSMKEKTALWKYDWRTRKPFIEFDFLAILKTSADIKFTKRCPECFSVNILPVNLELFAKYYKSMYDLNLRRQINSFVTDNIFMQETSYCLSSLCSCLSVKYSESACGEGTCIMLGFSFKPSSPEKEQGCDKCIVNKLTGTLRVNTSVKSSGYGKPSSLVFLWESKAKTLCTRDKQLSPSTHKMDYFTIYIDFLPALEVLQSEQQESIGEGCPSSYERYGYIVPKNCVVCD